MDLNLSVAFAFVSIAVTAAYGGQLQCKDPVGRSVDWFAAIKLPNLQSNESDGTVYVYLDARKQEWTFLKGITTEKSAIGHTLSQMYAPTAAYNDSIAWLVYNDEPSDRPTTFTLGHSKGTVVADSNTGFWLVHSVPHLPSLPYQNNSYQYPRTGIKYGQSFLCISMTAEELDKVGQQLINNEVYVYGSHFGKGLSATYPGLYNATLSHKVPSSKDDSVRLQNLRSLENNNFLSVSKNRNFEKDLYEDLIANMTKSNVYAETWLNSRDKFNSSCSGRYKAINVKSLTMKGINGIENCSFHSANDHSKWVITGRSSVPWTCIGDINRALGQTKRGGGTVCIDSIIIWNQYKKLVSEIEKCKK